MTPVPLLNDELPDENGCASRHQCSTMTSVTPPARRRCQRRRGTSHGTPLKRHIEKLARSLQCDLERTMECNDAARPLACMGHDFRGFDLPRHRRNLDRHHRRTTATPSYWASCAGARQICKHIGRIRGGARYGLSIVRQRCDTGLLQALNEIGRFVPGQDLGFGSLDAACFQRAQPGSAAD